MLGIVFCKGNNSTDWNNQKCIKYLFFSRFPKIRISCLQIHTRQKNLLLLMEQTGHPLSQNKLESGDPTTAGEKCTNLYNTKQNKIKSPKKMFFFRNFFFFQKLSRRFVVPNTKYNKYLLFSNQLYHVFLCISGIILSSPSLTTCRYTCTTIFISNILSLQDQY